ncbi:hypothetical protein ERJ75_001846800 [Trypanosoma vivax]|nr:hypothetical protein ERJ75_001846800 [Trypanosoma vivax]
MRREGNCGAFRWELGREVDDDLETVTAGADSLGLTPCGDVCRNADFGLSMRRQACGAGRGKHAGNAASARRERRRRRREESQTRGGRET